MDKDTRVQIKINNVLREPFLIDHNKMNIRFRPSHRFLIILK